MLNRAPSAPRRRLTAFVLTAALILAGVRSLAAAPAQPPLTNDDIVAMVQAGLPQDVIFEKIKTSRTAFDTSTQALVALKKAGVSGDVIRVMVNPAAESRPAVAATPWANPNGPAPCQAPAGGTPPWLTGASPAMWYSDPARGDRVEISYERGTITHVGFAGFGSSLLVLHPLKAAVRVPGQTQFWTCINPTDAPLVHFSIDKDSDERNTSVGKIMPWKIEFHISDEDLVRFSAEKTPEGYFKITTASPLQAGEYGFVPQGNAGFFAAGERVYSFGVD
jgi:hypothetical protein